MLKRIDRKYLMMGGMVFGLILVVTVIYFIVNLNLTLSFEQIEKKMVKAGEDYLKENPNHFPEESGDVVININQLEQIHMKTLIEYLDEGVSCFGEVRVTRFEGLITLYPYLDCGEHYKTQSLYEQIMQTQGIVEQGPGIYQVEDELVFRGEMVNNFVSFGNRLWRIVSIDQENGVKLVENVLQKGYVWDNRYNVERNGRDGINEFFSSKTEHSQLKKHFDELMLDEKYLKLSEWGQLDYMDLCVGARGLEEKNKTGTIECAKIVENQIIGIPTAHEFLRISLDPDCVITTDRACQNYNYLGLLNKRILTLTPVAGASNRVYMLNSKFLTSNVASLTTSVRLVIKLNKNVIGNEGIGTEEEPYIVRN